MKNTFFILLISFLSLLIFLIIVPDARPFVLVGSNEFASFYRDNRLLKIEDKEGLYGRIPFSTKVKKYSYQSADSDVEIRYITVDDNIYVNMSLTVLYGIGSPENFLDFTRAGTPDPSVIFNDNVPKVFKTGLSYLYHADGINIYDKFNAISDSNTKKIIIDTVNENIEYTGYEVRQFYISNIEYTPVSRDFIDKLQPDR